MSLTVADKTGTTTLVSDDGSTCEVPESVFARVQVGERRGCAGKRADRSGTYVPRGRVPPPGRPPMIPRR